jgi:pyrrolidone-carboxylate peptidase
MPSAEKNRQQILDLGIPEKVLDQDILCGLAEIAAFTGLSISSIRRRIKRAGLPAAPAVSGGKYIISKFALERWITMNHIRMVEQHNWDRR